MVKNLPAVPEPWVQLLGCEDSPGKELPSLIVLLGKFHAQRSLVGYSPRGRRELNMTERPAHA